MNTSILRPLVTSPFFFLTGMFGMELFKAAEKRMLPQPINLSITLGCLAIGTALLAGILTEELRRGREIAEAKKAIEEVRRRMGWQDKGTYISDSARIKR